MDAARGPSEGQPIAPPALAGPLPARAPGAGEILRFAIPLMLGLMTSAINTFVDTLFIGRLGTAALAAVPLAAMTYMVGWVLVIGTMRGAIAFCARAYGAGRHEQIGVIVAHYHLLALAGLPLLLLFVQAWPLLSAFAHLEPQADALAATYLHIRVGDIPFSLLLVLYSAFYQSIGNSRFPMLVSASAVGLNIVLDYGLIFGHFGLPALGVAGSALATVFAQACGAAAIMAASFAGPQRRRFRLRLVVPLRRDLLRDILRVGVPSGLGDCLEVGAWAGFQLIVGRLGDVALAASNIGMQATQLLFLPGFAFGIAGASYIGRFLGAGHPLIARRTALRVLYLGVGYMGLLGLPLWFFGEALAAQFTADARVIHAAGLLFKVMALYQVFDGMGFITRTVLGGAGDTRVPMLVLAAGALAVLFPGAWLLARVVSPPLIGAWLGACVYMVLYAAAMQWRLHSGAWMRIRLAV
jgi:MATE family, multidrug efflux pump